MGRWWSRGRRWGEGSGVEVVSPLADPRGHLEHAPPLGPISFNFIQFSAKLLSNNRLAALFVLAPPLENPGSATDRRWEFYFMVLPTHLINLDTVIHHKQM